MEQIGQYLLRLTAAALICGIVTSVFGNKGTLGAVIKLLAGIFLTLSIVSPWAQLRLDALWRFTDGLTTAGESLSSTGQNAAREAMAQSISRQAAAYILDKAESFGAELTVEVELDGSDIPVPCRVRLSGHISPYGKQKLSSIIAEDLGIPAEEQIWI